MGARLSSAVVATCLIASLAPAPSAHAAFPGTNGKIAFNVNFQIYTINPDGTGQTRITNDPASDVEAVWSPDGTKIAFETNRDGNYEIYTMNADGTNQTRLTNSPGGDSYAAWSPDGTKIAFETARNGSLEIYTMNADGTNQTRLTPPAFGTSPVWSPDGTKIAFDRGAATATPRSSR